MITITARNVNGAWEEAKILLHSKGLRRESRNGPVLEIPHPVTTCYIMPTERVLFDAVRDANPFFHLFEALWMLTGRNDVAYPAQFASQLAQYSDDGATFHGAYGRRWRNHFRQGPDWNVEYMDQLSIIISMLRANPDDRRAVLQMWDPAVDLGRQGKDLPCNDTIFFKIRDWQLLMTVCCRSNDIVMGCYGANAVHMSVLQEYMAAMIGVDVGEYNQVSDSWHGYLANFDAKAHLLPEWEHDLYSTKHLKPQPLVDNPLWFDMECALFVNDDPDEWNSHTEWKNLFFPQVAIPMRLAWAQYKAKCRSAAMTSIAGCLADDWRLACTQWLERRKW